MESNQLVNVLAKYHQRLASYSTLDLASVARKAEINNPWFTPANFFFAFEGIKQMLSPDSIAVFLKKYHDLEPIAQKKIGLVLAGNIPAVGFHDVLVVLLSGAQAVVKLSSQDKVLIPFLIQELAAVNEVLAGQITLVEKVVLDDLDAVIATGSDNTARYFEQYFSRKPNLIRQSRTSLAVLTGHETPEELQDLTHDIFLYFGLGCRNVSKILLLEGVDMMPLLAQLEKRTDVNNFSKYDNNYLYYKSIYLINREEFLDTETVLIRQNEQLHSPISVLYYQKFKTQTDIEQYIVDHQERIQCVVGKDRAIKLGGAQRPTILDYADNVDTRLFIQSV